MVIISKKRNNETSVEVKHFIGNVRGKKVLIVDDLIESGGTIVQAEDVCKKEGADKVYCAITHGCFTIPSCKLTNAIEGYYEKDNMDIKVQPVINKLFISNSISFKTFPSLKDKFVTVDMSYWFATAIKNIHNNETVSELFK